MASNIDAKHAPPSAQRQEKTDDGLQFDEATTFSADPVPKTDAFTTAASDSDEDGNEIRKNPFLDPDVAEHWTAVYEEAEYESRHVFDPTLTWTEEEEKKLIRRLDWRVCLWAVSCSLRSLLYSADKIASVSCSLVYKLIEEIWFKLWQTTSSRTST